MNILIFLVAFISVYRVDSLYFHIRETERKCFIEEVPDETLVVGKKQTLKQKICLEIAS